MRDRLSDYQEMYGDLFNLEATPAESTTYRFAKHDTEEFADIITAACKDQAPYYTNSTHLPVNYTEDIFDALEMEDEMQTLYTSGTVFHGFLGERMPDWKAAANLVKKIAYNFKLPYYTLSPTYSICENHGYIAGEHFSCPHCGNTTEVYSRITGYYRPVRNWNDGKSSEFENRKTYEPEELFSINKNLLDEAGVDLPRVGTQTLGRANEVKAATSKPDTDKLILVTTKTCPNCQAAKNYLNQAGIEYDVILADEADGAEIAGQYNISAAPTLIVQSGEEAELYSNVSNIRAYIGKRS